MGHWSCQTQRTFTNAPKISIFQFRFAFGLPVLVESHHSCFQQQQKAVFSITSSDNPHCMFPALSALHTWHTDNAAPS